MRRRRTPAAVLALVAMLVFVLQVACSPKHAAVSPTTVPEPASVSPTTAPGDIRVRAHGFEVLVTVEQLAARADIVVRGVPASILTERSELPPQQNVPETRYLLTDRVEFSISEYLKGGGAGTITVFTGSDREISSGSGSRVIVEDSIFLRLNQEYILFLWNPADDGYRIVGPVQGKWNVEGSEAVREPFGPVRMTVDTLRERVRPTPDKSLPHPVL